MRISKDIQGKMHKLAQLTSQAGMLDREINDYLKVKDMILMSFVREMEQHLMN